MGRLEGRYRIAAGAAVWLALAAVGCGGDDTVTTQTVALNFEAADGQREVGCGDTVEGLGTDGESSVEISDLRFYVSNVRVVTDRGEEAALELDRNEFQYVEGNGSVALVDLTGTGSGACAGDGLTYPEGTARTNAVITGKVAAEGSVTGVRFDVGLPQPLMKSVIADHTAEDAPSPLAEMHWSWAYAYRQFVMNFRVVDGEGVAGEGYLHVGSTDCGGDGTKALTDRDHCGRPNAAAVSLSPFDAATDTIGVDVRALLADLDLTVAVEDSTVPGVECHSSPMQPDCPVIFGNFGLDMASGAGNAADNKVFTVR